MVKQVATDLGRLVHHRDAELAEFRGVPDTGQHQQLRGVDGPRAQHHLPSGADGLATAVGVVVLDSHRAGALEDHPPDGGLGDQSEVGTVEHRLEIRISATPPRTAALRHGGLTEAVGHRTVGCGDRVAGLLGRAQPRRCRGARTALLGDHQRPVLDPIEVRTQVGVIPLLAGLLRPLVVVGGEAGHPHHRVHRRRTAEHLAPRPVDLPAADLLLRLGQVIPVDGAAEEFGERSRDVDELVGVHRSGLEHHNIGARMRAQTVGDHRPGRTGPHHDEVTVHWRSIGTRLSPAVRRAGA